MTKRRSSNKPAPELQPEAEPEFIAMVADIEGDVPELEAVLLDPGDIDPETATVEAIEPDAVEEPGDAPPSSTYQTRIRVIRSISRGGGKVYEPGTLLTIPDDLEMPFHRLRQLEEQRSILILKPDEA